MGININRLRSKISECINKKNKDYLKKSTINLAKILRSKKFNSLILLNYAPNLKKLSELVGVSHPKLNKLFKSVYGKTFCQWCRGLQINASKKYYLNIRVFF